MVVLTGWFWNDPRLFYLRKEDDDEYERIKEAESLPKEDRLETFGTEDPHPFVVPASAGTDLVGLPPQGATNRRMPSETPLQGDQSCSFA